MAITGLVTGLKSKLRFHVLDNVPEKQYHCPSGFLVAAIQKTVTDAVLTSVKDSLLKSRDDKIANLELQNAKMKAEIEEQEQHSRRNCLIVHGIEENEGEVTDSVIQKFVRTHLKMDLKVQDIDRSHRHGTEKVTYENQGN